MTLWEQVVERKVQEGCRCELRDGMTFRELIELEAGCRGTLAGGPGWVCEVLDFYRTKVGAVEATAKRRKEREQA